MKLINHTKYSRKMLRDICEFCLPKDLKKVPFIIEFGWRKDLSGVGGTFYHSKPMRITIRMPKKKSPYSYPYEWAVWKAIEKKGYVDHIRMDFEEEIVHVVAHEMRHMRQYVNGRIHKVFGSKGRMSERDADAYAIKTQRAWRRLQKPVIELNMEILEKPLEYYFKKEVNR